MSSTCVSPNVLIKKVNCLIINFLINTSYGNNAVEMETTAVYDKSRKEFIINTPTPLAQKYWITNGAVHAKYCVVFAQLHIEGTYLIIYPLFFFVHIS